MKNLFFGQKYWRLKILPNINDWSEILKVVHNTWNSKIRKRERNTVEREREMTGTVTKYLKKDGFKIVQLTTHIEKHQSHIQLEKYRKYVKKKNQTT